MASALPPLRGPSPSNKVVPETMTDLESASLTANTDANANLGAGAGTTAGPGVTSASLRAGTGWDGLKPRVNARQQSIRINGLPDKIKAILSEFDDGDGEINVMELAETVQALRSTRSTAKRNMRMAICGGVVSIFMLLAVLGLTFVAAKLANPTGVTGDSLVVAGTEDPVRVASSDFEVEADGSMKTRTGGAMTTAAATTESQLTSQFPDKYFTELRYIQLASPSGAMLHLDVIARARLPKKLSSHGSIVRLITPVGSMTLDGDVATFDDQPSKLLRDAGFEMEEEASSSGRRLLGGAAISGFFNTIAELTEGLEEDQSATFPDSDYTYVATEYTECGLDGEGEDEELDDCFADEPLEAEEGDSACLAYDSAGAAPVAPADKAVTFGLVKMGERVYKKEVRRISVRTVGETTITRTALSLSRFPGQTLVTLEDGSVEYTTQEYNGMQFHCSNATTESGETTTSSAALAEAASTLAGEEVSADVTETATYLGLTTVHGVEVRKYQLVTTDPLAAAGGSTTILAYDDGEAPVRLEFPDVGTIIDLSDMSTDVESPHLAENLFVMPTSCPGDEDRPIESLSPPTMAGASAAGECHLPSEEWTDKSLAVLTAEAEAAAQAESESESAGDRRMVAVQDDTGAAARRLGKYITTRPGSWATSLTDLQSQWLGCPLGVRRGPKNGWTGKTSMRATTECTAPVPIGLGWELVRFVSPEVQRLRYRRQMQVQEQSSRRTILKQPFPEEATGEMVDKILTVLDKKWARRGKKYRAKFSAALQAVRDTMVARFAKRYSGRTGITDIYQSGTTDTAFIGTAAGKSCGKPQRSTYFNWGRQAAVSWQQQSRAAVATGGGRLTIEATVQHTMKQVSQCPQKSNGDELTNIRQMSVRTADAVVKVKFEKLTTKKVCTVTTTYTMVPPTPHYKVYFSWSHQQKRRFSARQRRVPVRTRTCEDVTVPKRVKRGKYTLKLPLALVMDAERCPARKDWWTVMQNVGASMVVPVTHDTEVSKGKKMSTYAVVTALDDMCISRSTSDLAHFYYAA